MWCAGFSMVPWNNLKAQSLQRLVLEQFLRQKNNRQQDGDAHDFLNCFGLKFKSAGIGAKEAPQDNGGGQRQNKIHIKDMILTAGDKPKKRIHPDKKGAGCGRFFFIADAKHDDKGDKINAPTDADATGDKA